MAKVTPFDWTEPTTRLEERLCIGDRNQLGHIHWRYDTEKQCQHKICRTHTTTPCLICGQNDHPLTEWINKGDMRWEIELRCPISRYNTWSEMSKEADDRTRYSFGAEKFLSKYGYCRDKVIEAFQIYEENGYGQMMAQSSPVLHRASKAALIAVCENARCLQQFKRTIYQDGNSPDTDEENNSC